MKGNMKHCRV